MNIAVLVSGGVDSSVALRLLQEQGHTVTAFYLKIWLEDELSFLGTCPWEEDLAYVRAVCEQAGVPLEVISLQKEYHEAIVAYTVAEIKQGRTPNPDMLCNQYIKFGAFYDLIPDTFDKVATGHYAQVVERDGRFELHRSPDDIKDQTYFLARLSQAQLSRALFPIGHLTKSQVRALAEKFDIPNKARKDSQGLCFLGKLKFSEFVRYHVGTQKGAIIEFETGKKLGDHEGFWFYTIGQRQGLRLAGGPWYVVAKNPKDNIVFVSKNYYAADKPRNQLTISDVQWLPHYVPTDDISVKLRHGSKEYQCNLVPQNNGTYGVVLNDHDQGIAPGQFAVFYQDGRCVGSGVIAEQQYKGCL